MGMGRGGMEALNRASRTAFFMVILVGSFLASSVPLVVCMADVISPCLLLSTFSCCNTCFGLKKDWSGYSFRTSLVDIPLLSLIRSLLIFGAYSACGLPSVTYRFYSGTAAVCGLISGIWLAVKAALFSDLVPPSNLGLKQAWIMPSLVFSSLVLALVHATVAYKIRSHDRRRFYFHKLDPEAVLVCKIALNRCQTFPRSISKTQVAKSNWSSNGCHGKSSGGDDRDLPAHMLADKDSLFMLCGSLLAHYKICEGKPRGASRVRATPSPPPPESEAAKKMGVFSSSTGMHMPLLSNPSSLEGLQRVDSYSGWQKAPQTGIVLLHGFGGGVFSWRHVMNPLACQVGVSVFAFDRPGWGLTSRPDRAHWEIKGGCNPYELESQVDLLFEFCKNLNLNSVVLVGHDDGGLLALMAAARSTQKASQVEVKGVALIGVSLSREVVPAFARVLLHTSLGRHMLRSLLRSEIGQVAVRRAWHDASKLTSDTLDLYKAPLRVEGWDKALEEISRASSKSVLSASNCATEVAKLLPKLPSLVIAGAEDNLVPLKSAQALAIQLPHSRVVAISGCGHLPQEESPGALLAALVPFISSLELTTPRQFHPS